MDAAWADAYDLPGFLREGALIARWPSVTRRQIGQGLTRRLVQLSVQPPGGLVGGAGPNLHGFGIDGDADWSARTSFHYAIRLFDRFAVEPGKETGQAAQQGGPRRKRCDRCGMPARLAPAPTAVPADYPSRRHRRAAAFPSARAGEVRTSALAHANKGQRNNVAAVRRRPGIRPAGEGAETR